MSPENGSGIGNLFILAILYSWRQFRQIVDWNENKFALSSKLCYNHLR